MSSGEARCGFEVKKIFWSSRNYFKWKTYWHIEIKAQLIRRIIGNEIKIKTRRVWNVENVEVSHAHFLDRQKMKNFIHFFDFFSLFLNQWHNVSKWTLYKYSSRPVAARWILHGQNFVTRRSSGFRGTTNFVPAGALEGKTERDLGLIRYGSSEVHI